MTSVGGNELFVVFKDWVENVEAISLVSNS